MRKLFYLLAFVAVTVMFQSCEAESTDEQVELIENAKSKTQFQTVDPDEVEDPDDRGNG
mgnify:CR=1 FL=1